MVVRSWWIGLADDECGEALAGACQRGSLAVSPSVLARAALISHDGRCQFVCCCSSENLIIQANVVSFLPVYLLTKFSPPLFPLWPELSPHCVSVLPA